MGQNLGNQILILLSADRNCTWNGLNLVSEETLNGGLVLINAAILLDVLRQSFSTQVK